MMEYQLRYISSDQMIFDYTASEFDSFELIVLTSEKRDENFSEIELT